MVLDSQMEGKFWGLIEEVMLSMCWACELNWETNEFVYGKIMFVWLFYMNWWSVKMMHKQDSLVSKQGMKL